MVRVGPDRLARFRRKAHVLAPVNHPNIAHVYGLEPTCVATAAAIMNAIHDAVGVRITSLPATAEKVHAALKAKRAQETRQLTA
jgi:CO/xanthine dehydrogenase Mo-binding subunit